MMSKATVKLVSALFVALLLFWRILAIILIIVGVSLLQVKPSRGTRRCGPAILCSVFALAFLLTIIVLTRARSLKSNFHIRIRRIGITTSLWGFIATRRHRRRTWHIGCGPCLVMQAMPTQPSKKRKPGIGIVWVADSCSVERGGGLLSSRSTGVGSKNQVKKMKRMPSHDTGDSGSRILNQPGARFILSRC